VDPVDVAALQRTLERLGATNQTSGPAIKGFIT